MHGSVGIVPTRRIVHGVALLALQPGRLVARTGVRRNAGRGCLDTRWAGSLRSADHVSGRITFRVRSPRHLTVRLTLQVLGRLVLRVLPVLLFLFLLLVLVRAASLRAPAEKQRMRATVSGMIPTETKRHRVGNTRYMLAVGLHLRVSHHVVLLTPRG